MAKRSLWKQAKMSHRFRTVLDTYHSCCRDSVKNLRRRSECGSPNIIMYAHKNIPYFEIFPTNKQLTFI